MYYKHKLLNVLHYMLHIMVYIFIQKFNVNMNITSFDGYMISYLERPEGYIP